MATLLRMATAGSVDDGKSTLVGRLLHDSKAVLADQLEAVERVSRDKGLGHVDLALLTDGLRAEREQGITIDVAYRYFATAKRSFILADCPGHVQYTRNTVTGSSTADVLVVLVDARHGVVEQTRRHLAVGHLLRVPHVVVAVNKIDLVDWSEQRFTEVAAQVHRVTTDLGIESVQVLPVSALIGDNVVSRSRQMDWYTGPSLLEFLETLPADDPSTRHTETGEVDRPLRFPVQLALRPQGAAVAEELGEYRGYAGQISSGVIRRGERVVVLPSGKYTTVVGIDTASGELTEAFAPQSVALRLADEIDITRGELIASAQDAPVVTKDLRLTAVWLHERALTPGAKVLVKHTTRTVQGIVTSIDGRLDLDSLDVRPAGRLELNDIGRLRLRLSNPVMADSYEQNRSTGSLLLVDSQSGANLAAGMIDGTGAVGLDEEGL